MHYLLQSDYVSAVEHPITIDATVELVIAVAYCCDWCKQESLTTRATMELSQQRESCETWDLVQR